MKIALDYDGTYTADPELWNGFIKNALDRGHEIVCVTMRYPHETIQMPIPVIYTSRHAKFDYAPDAIWIDDKPSWLFQDSF